MTSVQTLDVKDLRNRVADVYKQVAEEPEKEYHFAMGHGLAERLGYSRNDLDRIPQEATASFAGVGYHFALADLKQGESVVDLGSGSGMDSFIAALKVGKAGSVTGIDMTDAQLHKATKLRTRENIKHLSFKKGFIENLPLEDTSVDVVISNGVINLSPYKKLVFQEAARILRPGGRLAISDIVTEVQLDASITCNASLWAACIGGAAQEDTYKAMLEQAGFELISVQENTAYQFLSKSALGATETYGVKSISLLANKK